MNECRLIELTEGCMGGESAIYYTDAPNEEIVKAIELYRKSDDQSGFDSLESDYIMRVVLDSRENCFYGDIRPNIIVDMVYEIYE